MSRSREEILAEVDELATEVLRYEPELSVDAARAVVWEAVDELYGEYLEAPVDATQPIEKSDREPTLGDEICGVVRKRAAHLAWTEWPHKSISDLEWDIWQTPEGNALYELYISSEGRLPLSQVEHRIAKSSRSSDAWAVLAEWGAG